MSGPLHGFRRKLLSLLLFVAFSGPAPEPARAQEAQEDGGGAASCDAFSVPFAPSVRIAPHDPSAPEGVAALGARHGTEWLLLWDPLTGTPRYARPRSTVRVLSAATVEPGPGRVGREALEEEARRFVDQNAAFFGVGSEELSAAEILSLRDGWILAFSQVTPSGLLVRGASLRLWLLADGTLQALKAYLIRLGSPWRDGLPPQVLFPSSRSVAERLEREGLEVLSLLPELAFPPERGGEPEPIWRVTARARGGGSVEELRDASGEVALARCPLAARFDGSVLGMAADLGDPNALPASVLARPQPLAGVVVAGPGGEPVAVTDAAGRFHLEGGGEALTLRAELRVGSCPEPGEDELCPPAALIAIPPPPGCPIVLVTPVRCPGEEGPEEEPGCLPGLERTGLGEEPVEFLFTPEEMGVPADLLGWWLQVHAQAWRILEGASRVIREEMFPQERPGVFSPLELQAEAKNDVAPVLYEAPEARGAPGKVHFQRWTHCQIVPAGRERDPCDLDPRLLTDPYQVVPSVVGHEVAHHVIHSLTRLSDHPPFEEGLADVLTAYANDNRAIAFQGSNPGPGGFLVDEWHPCRHDRRVAVGNVLWQLYSKVSKDDPMRLDDVSVLLYRWILTNRGQDHRNRTFDDPGTFLEELLGVDAVRPDFGEVVIREVFGRDSPFNVEHRFRRADANNDFRSDMSDAIFTLGWLFRGQSRGNHDCPDALDMNDDGGINLTDPIFLLLSLFRGGQLIPPPAECGTDETPDTIGCYKDCCGTGLDERPCPPLK